MYPPKFDYYRAGSLSEAISLLQAHDGAKLLAGGHSLIPALNLRLADPGALIDIGRLDELKGITATADGGCKIGALTVHAAVASSNLVPAGLSQAAGMIGDPQVRNRGTVGGNVSHADPASDLPTILLALKATFHVVGPNGARTIAADDFFVDLFATALGEGEVLTAVTIPGSSQKAGSAYAKLSNPASRYAMVGAGAVVSQANGVCTAASVAVGGLTPKATRGSSVEAALVGKPLNADTIAAAAQTIGQDLGDDILGDMHANSDYRRQMAVVFVRRALTQAAERA